jgi:hypothetical protein
MGAARVGGTTTVWVAAGAGSTTRVGVAAGEGTGVAALAGDAAVAALAAVAAAGGTALGVRTGVDGACAGDGAQPHTATSKTSTQASHGSRTGAGGKLLTVITCHYTRGERRLPLAFHALQ